MRIHHMMYANKKSEVDSFMESVRILVIDDEEAIGNVIKDYLEAQGYEVFWAEDGLSAIDMFQQGKP
jgi:CheY-like chemotaxis protein